MKWGNFPLERFPGNFVKHYLKDIKKISEHKMNRTYQTPTRIASFKYCERLGAINTLFPFSGGKKTAEKNWRPSKK